MFTLTCVSFFLGYTAVFLLGATVFLLVLLGRIAHRAWPSLPTAGPVIWLALLVPVWLVFWRPLATLIH